MKKFLRFLSLTLWLSASAKPLIAQWVQVQSVQDPVNCFAVCGNTVYAGTHSQGVFISTDAGLNWTNLVPRLVANSFTRSGRYKFAHR